MKSLLKISTVCLILLGISCNQLDNRHDPDAEMKYLLNKVEFQGITINVDEAKFENIDDQRSIISIPVHSSSIEVDRVNIKKENYLNLVFDKESNSFLTSILISSNAEIGNASGDFTGVVDIEFLETTNNKVVMLTDPGSISVDFNDGRIASSEVRLPIKKLDGARPEGCGGFEGAVICAGWKFERADCCFEEAVCYLTFIYCLAYRIADCGINGCE